MKNSNERSVTVGHRLSWGWRWIGGIVWFWVGCHFGMGVATGHDLGRLEIDHEHDREERVTPERVVNPPWLLAQREVRTGTASGVEVERASGGGAPTQAQAFEVFAPRTKVRWDDRYVYVESDGIPAHGMMIGITSWQQQVPLPQFYTGANAWRFPRVPVPSKNPIPVRGRFLRGAIAIAANGIPIFNPQNNRGELSIEIGELDRWGGHCGRADDYHYHAAPFHLQEVLGKALPIAYALDGYPIYGLTEPDGKEPLDLDSFHGHEVAGLGYHYHGSTRYPYVLGGFHGEVVEREGQVDPQPRAQPRRESGTPLRGARITGFGGFGTAGHSLKYEVGNQVRFVNYEPLTNGGFRFEYVDGSGTVERRTYSSGRVGGAGGGAGGRDGEGGRGRGQGAGEGRSRSDLRGEERRADQGAMGVGGSDGFSLRSPAVPAGGRLPAEFTGDGRGWAPPLEWSGAPQGTRAYAVIMHHVDPEGFMKWYWTQFNIPGDATGLGTNAVSIGRMGNNSVNRGVGYAPPHSKGPGIKTYIVTAYALSREIDPGVNASEISREVLLKAMKDAILARAELRFEYERSGAIGAGEDRDGDRDGTRDRGRKPRGGEANAASLTRREP